MATSADRKPALATLVGQAQALAQAQPVLMADVLREAMAVRDSVPDAALCLSQLDPAAAAAVLARLDVHEVLPLAQALLRQRSVSQAQAEQVLTRLLAEATQRVVPLQDPAAFLAQVLPRALGTDQAQPVLQWLGLGQPPTQPPTQPASTVALRARLSQAEVDALLNPPPDVGT